MICSNGGGVFVSFTLSWKSFKKQKFTFINLQLIIGELKVIIIQYLCNVRVNCFGKGLNIGIYLLCSNIEVEAFVFRQRTDKAFLIDQNQEFRRRPSFLRPFVEKNWPISLNYFVFLSNFESRNSTRNGFYLCQNLYLQQ